MEWGNRSPWNRHVSSFIPTHSLLKSQPVFRLLSQKKLLHFVYALTLSFFGRWIRKLRWRGRSEIERVMKPGKSKKDHWNDSPLEFDSTTLDGPCKNENLVTSPCKFAGIVDSESLLYNNGLFKKTFKLIFLVNLDFRQFGRYKLPRTLAKSVRFLRGFKAILFKRKVWFLHLCQMYTVYWVYSWYKCIHPRDDFIHPRDDFYIEPTPPGN